MATELLMTKVVIKASERRRKRFIGLFAWFLTGVVIIFL